MSARDLYQELILDHARSPQNFGALEQATAHSHRENISCGDTIDLYLLVENDQIVDVRFEGQGCALSTASASMMTDVIKGKSLSEVQQLTDHFRAYISGEADALDEALEDFEAFQGVRQLPARVKCVTLPWVTLADLLAQKPD
ncbi:MAG: SUF system NifU family Fe-S cluster assembly protein [Anaerolineae bacterium]|nr:SUF system NifU family Fe-S cluster assembly protein [Anaerolineae bacterium]MCA9909880.1 SUF system NifU family Fe-S cluster assembly protein [Anaerolineae bacterium]